MSIALPLMSPFFTLYNFPSLQVTEMRLTREEIGSATIKSGFGIRNVNNALK